MTSLTSKSRNLKVLAIFDPEHHHNKVSEALRNTSITCLNSCSSTGYRLHWNHFRFFPHSFHWPSPIQWVFNITQCQTPRDPSDIGQPFQGLWTSLNFAGLQSQPRNTPPSAPAKNISMNSLLIFTLGWTLPICKMREFHLRTHNQINLI